MLTVADINDALDREIRANRLTRSDVADLLGIARSSLYRKLSGEHPFRLDETLAICNACETDIVSLLNQAELRKAGRRHA